MRSWCATLAGAVWCVAWPGAGQATEWYTGAETPVDRRDWIVAVDTSLSVTSQGSVFGKVTGTGAATGGLSEDGLRVRVESLAGHYDYQARGGARVDALQSEGAAMVGYEWVWRDAALAGFVGANIRNTDLSRPDPGNSVSGTGIGVKAALEYYARPSERTMVQASASYSTTFNAYFARLRAGYALGAGGAYLGPEVSVLGDDFFRQYRIGAHLTGMTLGSVEVGLAVGYMNDRVLKNGLYTTADLRARF